ncbi:MAG TPA: NAD(P)-dependent oxidoreductase [Arenibaculum sp.]|nr:NAD(P)-dependent oxidoreductase [Arenibaculum sp.]
MTDIIIAEPIEERIVRDLGLRYDVWYDRRFALDLTALSRALTQARALIVGEGAIIDADLLAAAPRLEVIGCVGTAPGRVDEEACRARGIEIHVRPTVQEATRAGQVVDAVLELLRHAGGIQDRGRDRGGRLLGLVGFDRLARDVAVRACRSGLRVAAYEPMVDHDDPLWVELGVEPMPFHRLLEEADAVSVHIPLIEETHGLIDWETIVEMRPGAVLVNASSPAVVDGAAVKAALRGGRLGGALLDLDADPGHADGPVSLPQTRIGSLIVEKVRATLEARRPI